MIRFLKNVAKSQEDLINKMTKDEELSFSIGEVAGVNLSVPGKKSIPFITHQEILKNLDGFKKQWKRFNENSNIIILEKNFLLNAIRKSNQTNEKLFSFSDNVTSIDIPKDFYPSKPYRSHGGWWSMFYVLGALLSSCLFYLLVRENISDWVYLSVFFALLSLAAVVLWFCYRRSLKKYLVEELEWKLKYKNNPGLFFSTKHFSYQGKSTLPGCESIHVKFVFSNFDVKAICQKAFYALSSGLGDVVGNAGWLWFYSADDPDAISSLEYNERNIGSDYYYSFLSMVIDIKNFNILPVVETKYSFIFNIENFKNISEDEDCSKHLASIFLEKVAPNVSWEMFVPVVN